MLCVFDLDHTLLNSSHRQITKPDGSLDLAHWIENSTPEKVLRDSPLPLLKEYGRLMANGHTMIICTARVMAAADYELLRNHGIFFHHMLCRPLGCREADHTLKLKQLRELARKLGYSWARFCSTAIMFEDNQNVINLMRWHGMATVDAVKWNRAAA